MIQAKNNTNQGFIYCRESTDKQGIDGLGMSAQETIGRAKAKELGLEVVEVYKEIESGRKSKRPQFVAMMEKAAEIQAVVIVAAMSRLTRDFNFMSYIAQYSESRGIGIVACDVPSLGDPAQTKLIWRMLASVAEFEVEQTRQRTKRALNEVKKKIKKDGSYWTKETKDKKSRKITSLGNPNVKKISRKGGQAMRENSKVFAKEVYPFISEIEKAGITSLRGIAKALNARGIETYQVQKQKTGIPQAGKLTKKSIWRAEQVKRIKIEARAC